RLRYGILPYSSTVNVGRLLRAEDTSYVRTSAPYDSYGCVKYKKNGNCDTYGYDQFIRDVTSEVTSASTTTWPGCIEERKTVSTITSTSGYTIPSGALDLNIDLKPTNDDSRWPAYLPGRVDRKNQSACPTQAKLLQT